MPRTPVRRPLLIVTSLAFAFLPTNAFARAFLPPPNKLFAGVSFEPVSAYTSAVGKHPAVFQTFIAWGQYLPGIAQLALDEHAPLEIHITTAFGSREAITPAGIANGQGDDWLIGLNNALYQTSSTTAIRASRSHLPNTPSGTRATPGSWIGCSPGSPRTNAPACWSTTRAR